VNRSRFPSRSVAILSCAIHQTATARSVSVLAFIVSSSGKITASITATTAGGIDNSDMVPGLTGLKTVTSLPAAAGYSGSRLVLNSVDAKLYRYVGGAWIKAVDGADVTAATLPGVALVNKSIGTDQLMANSVTANEIKVGTIGAAQIAAGAISTSKLLITSMSELNPDPGFRDTGFWDNVGIYNGALGTSAGSVPGWYNIHGSDIDSIMGTRMYAMLWEAYFSGTGRQHLWSKTQYNIKGGMTYQLSATGRNASSQNINLYMRLLNRDNALIADVPLAWTPGEDVYKSTQFVAPASVFSYQYIVFNTSGIAWAGNAQISNLQTIEAAGATAIKDGAITTDKITVGQLNGDRIAVGTLDANTLKANSILAGSVTVNGTALSTTQTQAANGGLLNWYDASAGNQYQFYGNKITRDAVLTGWYSNAYTKEIFRNSATITGTFDTVDAFIGLSVNRVYNNAADYQTINYSLHRSSNGNIYVYESGNSIVLGAEPGGAVSYSIVYDGRSVSYIRNNDNLTLRQVAAGPNLAFVGAVSLYSQGSSVSNLKVIGGMDNSLTAADPAARINAYSTQIDPGRIRVGGGGSIRNWMAGDDSTEINGGAIKANTIQANKLTIGNRGVTMMGVDFAYNRSDGALYWSAGYVFYTDDNNNAQSIPINSGGAAWNGQYTYIYWSQGSNNLSPTTQWNTVQANNGTYITVCTWFGGANFTPNYGGTIVDGDRITVNSIQANRMNVGSLSAITANIGLLKSADSGQRYEMDNNGYRYYDSAGTLRIKMGA
jgi:hypothetical protein